MVQQAVISPDGQHVAILGGPANDRRVSIATIDQPDMPTLKLGDVEAVDLTWAGDNYVIARVAYSDAENTHVAYRLERNVAIDVKARVVARLLEGAVGLSNMTAQPIIGVVEGPPTKVIVEGYKEIWRADVASGKGSIQETGSASFWTSAWGIDSAGEARVRLDSDNETLRIMGRPKGVKSWRLVWSGPYDDQPDIYYGYSERDAAVYVYEEKDGVGRLALRNLADSHATPFGPPVKDGMFSTIWDDNLKVIVGIGREQDRETIEWLDPELRAVHQVLAKMFAAQDVTLTSWSADRQRFVVRTASPGDPAVWYLYDRTREELSPLGEEYPELKGFKFGETRWFKYKARDGLEIPAYLTLPPKSVAGAGRPPLIILPHGGPTSRDEYDFDYMTQFFASRGYAVLRPQFRGSYGFGKPFEKAGDGEWGGKMQTDLLDGLAALANSPDVDAQRACVVGASFGGYAALAAATLHPEAYRCAASVSGISDLGILLGDAPSYPAVRALRISLGKAPKALLDSTSPARIASRAGVPVLLVHGDKDTVVLPVQSQLMLAALKAAGKPVEMVTLSGENHYMVHSATRTQMLESIAAFLAKNRPPVASPGAAAKGR
jgi:dipeptidyl aminopeptidase/acylaminoacyl peptidase